MANGTSVPIYSGYANISPALAMPIAYTASGFMKAMEHQQIFAGFRCKLRRISFRIEVDKTKFALCESCDIIESILKFASWSGWWFGVQEMILKWCDLAIEDCEWIRFVERVAVFLGLVVCCGV